MKRKRRRGRDGERRWKGRWGKDGRKGKGREDELKRPRGGKRKMRIKRRARM